MKLIDFYIIKRYIGTFLVMLLLFIPIGIMVDLAEKVDKLKEKEVPLEIILEYYIDFTWYFANLLFPIFLFLSVIWFTSKLANNTEVIAILSSGISFFRYLRPFLLGATLIAVFAFFAGMFIVPKSNQGFNDFRYKYLVKKEARDTDKVFQQINDKEFIYVNDYDPIRKQASDFTLEHFEGNTLKFKISARRIRWIDKDSIFRMSNFKKRTFIGDEERLEVEIRKDTIFDFRFVTCKLHSRNPNSYRTQSIYRRRKRTGLFFDQQSLIGSAQALEHPHIGIYTDINSRGGSLF
jgi:lipopolysaccharide export system permease protein